MSTVGSTPTPISNPKTPNPKTNNDAQAGTAKTLYLAETVLAIWKDTGILDPLQKHISSLLFGTLVKAGTKKSSLSSASYHGGGLDGVCPGTSPMLFSDPIIQDLLLDSICWSGNLTLAQLFHQIGCLSSSSSSYKENGNPNIVEWDIDEAWKAARLRVQKAFNVPATVKKSQLEVILLTALPNMIKKIHELEDKLANVSATLAKASTATPSTVSLKTSSSIPEPTVKSKISMPPSTTKSVNKEKSPSSSRRGWNSSTVLSPTVTSATKASTNSTSLKVVKSATNSPASTATVISSSLLKPSRKKEVSVTKVCKSSKQNSNTSPSLSSSQTASSKGYLKGTSASQNRLSNNSKQSSIIKSPPTGIMKNKTVPVSLKKSVSFTLESCDQPKDILDSFHNNNDNDNDSSSGNSSSNSSSIGESQSLQNGKEDDTDYWWTGESQIENEDANYHLSSVIMSKVFSEDEILGDIQSFIEEPIFDEQGCEGVDVDVMQDDDNITSVPVGDLRETAKSAWIKEGPEIPLAPRESNLMDMSEEDLQILATASSASPTISPQTEVKQPTSMMGRKLIMSKTLYRSPLTTIPNLGGASLNCNHFLSLWGMSLKQPPPPSLPSANATESANETIETLKSMSYSSTTLQSSASMSSQATASTINDDSQVITSNDYEFGDERGLSGVIEKSGYFFKSAQQQNQHQSEFHNETF